ncbi:MAG: MBOAT family O-acyltransferase [Ignavibacteriaceae bacterium]
MKMVTLREYVRKRNGVPLGAKGSLRNMFYRSLGSNQFSGFWHYWNPIWGYYLGKFIFKPLRNKLSINVSIILTFFVSGFIHDLVVSLVFLKIVIIITPWFVLMSFCLVISNHLEIRIKSSVWFYRAIINICYIGGCLLLALTFKGMYT